MLPQALQFAVVVVGVSQPSSAEPLQLPKPAAQVTTVHADDEHAVAPTLGSVAQLLPHAPQLAELLVVLTSQPFTYCVSQFA